MKKKLLAILLMGAMSCSIIGCGEKEDSSNENVDTIIEEESAEAEEAIEETADEVESEEEVVEENGFTHSPEFEEALEKGELSGRDSGSNYDNVVEAYRYCIEDFAKTMPEFNFTYSLIYINDDDVPELLMNPNTDESGIGVYVLSYYDSSIDIYGTFTTDFTYIPRGNVLDCSDFVLGAYVDNFVGIRDGKWVSIGHAEAGTLDPWAEDSYDENGDVILNTWTWNDEELGSQEKYDSTLALYYDIDYAEHVEYVSMDEIMEQIKQL